MKKPTSKAEQRDALRQETERFLRRGGEVTEIPQGLSAREPGEPPLAPNRKMFIEPRSSRTPVPEVVAAIEARRKQRPARKPRKRARSEQPRKKVIYDDFGEPLRHVWSDE